MAVAEENEAHAIQSSAASFRMQRGPVTSPIGPPGRRRRRAVLALGFVAVILAGCGSGSAVSSTSSTEHHQPAKFPHHPPPRPATAKHPRRRSTIEPKLAPIGRALRVHAPGTTLSVTIQALIDPLRDSGAAVPPGSHAIAVTAEIVDDGPGSYDSSSSGDFSVVSSSGPALPAFAPRGQCQTPLRDWDNEISPGETRNGCLAYSVPSSARITAIRFSPDAQPRGRVSWAG
jgi:hypothetical protein